MKRIFIFLILFSQTSIFAKNSNSKYPIDLDSSFLTPYLTGIILHSATARFMPYPYFDGYDKYILHQSSNLYFDEVSKKYRGSFSISGQYQKELGYGTGLEFEFQPVPFFGIFLEQTVLKKNSESVTNLKAGGRLALLQYTKFSLYGDIGWGNISGDTSISVGNGLLLAAFIRSYPFRPFSLEWKNTFCFNPQKECWESYFGLGVFLNRTEFFSTYKYLRTINSKTDDLLKKSHGISSGIRVHF